MESTRVEQKPDYSATGVYALPGEPAIVINGVPDIVPSDNNALTCTTNNVEPMVNAGFGEWLEGREIRKLFGSQSYSGTVTEFDKETGWYRVVYEDGDFEDLDWHELVNVLQPLDVTVSLKALALKTVRRNKKPVQKTVKQVGTKTKAVKGRKT